MLGFGMVCFGGLNVGMMVGKPESWGNEVWEVLVEVAWYGCLSRFSTLSEQEELISGFEIE
jgi:hypothetical protein